MSERGKKRLVGNLSRANCLVRVRCHSFTLSFSVTSILSVSLPLSLTLSRPPEGSTLELHENQSLPVSRPPPFHLVVMCVCFGGGVGGSFNLLLCFPCSFWEAQSHPFKKQITWYLLKVEGADKTKQTQFGLSVRPSEHLAP